MSRRKSPEDQLQSVRAHHMKLLADHLLASSKSQAQLARDLQTTPARITAIMQGRSEDFRLDALVLLLLRAGATPKDDSQVMFEFKSNKRSRTTTR